MDGKANLIVEALGVPDGSADSRYLQQELGQVLPVALAAIIELQPTDPVTVLALWLYKYRELNPLPASAPTTISTAEDCVSANEPRSMGASMVKEPAVMRSLPLKPQKAVSVRIVQNDDDDADDFIEVSGYSGSVQLDTAVHCEVVAMFSDIGDLFDDDDLG